MAGFLLLLLTGKGAEMISVNHTGTGSGNTGVQESFAINGDGRLAAFSGFATNYVALDTNSLSDVFVRDCVGRTNLWDTTASGGPPSGNIGSYPVAFTPDGRFLLFISRATNLVSRVAISEIYELYVRDLISNVTTLLSVSPDGTEEANSSVYSSGDRAATPDISSDGRFAAFASSASNLVGKKDTNSMSDVFCRDLLLGVTELITTSPAGTSLDRPTINYVMSTNGRYFSFETPATNVVAGLSNTGGVSQVYWRDRQAGTNTTVALTVDGAFVPHGSFLSAMSGDGRYVCFTSMGTNLVLNQNDQNGALDLFIRDMVASETWLVTRATNGTASVGQASGGQFSANGEWLLFSATATDLVPGVQDANSGAPDIFVHHLPTRTNDIVSRSYDGTSGADAYSSDNFARISSSGRFVLFTSTAANLIPGLTNHSQQFLLRDQRARRTLDPLRIPVPMPAFNRARFSISEDERFIFFLTTGNPDPFVSDRNQQLDLFRAPLFAPQVEEHFPGAVNAQGLAGANYILQATTNLVNWTSISTNLAGDDGKFTTTDPMPGNQERRFYRLLAP